MDKVIINKKTIKRMKQPFKFERDYVGNQIQNMDNHDIQDYNDTVRMTDPKLMANKKE